MPNNHTHQGDPGPGWSERWRWRETMVAAMASKMHFVLH